MSLFSSFAAVQLLIQILNAAAGILLVRTLSKPDYAWFTIASGIAATLTALADAGIASAVTAIGGRVWQDRAALASLIDSALRLRLRMAWLACLLVSPFSIYLLLKNGASAYDALLLTVIVLIPIWQISTSSIFMVVNRLHSRARQLQIADLLPSFTRAILTLLLVAFGWITPLTAVLAAVFAQFLQYVVIKAQVRPLIEVNSAPAPRDVFRQELGLRIRQVYPNALFNCVQSQISIWLVSIFAATSQVADLGALSRLAIVFALISAPFGQWLAPAFARATTHRKLFQIIVATTFIVGSFSSGLLFFAWSFPSALLWLLGPTYQHLEKELLMVLGSMALSCLSQSVWHLNTLRGWVKYLSLNIPLTLATQAIAMFFIHPNSVFGVALIAAIVSLVQLLHGSFVMAAQLLFHPINEHPATGSIALHSK